MKRTLEELVNDMKDEKEADLNKPQNLCADMEINAYDGSEYLLRRINTLCELAIVQQEAIDLLAEAFTHMQRKLYPKANEQH